MSNVSVAMIKGGYQGLPGKAWRLTDARGNRAVVTECGGRIISLRDRCNWERLWSDPSLFSRLQPTLERARAEGFKKIREEQAWKLLWGGIKWWIAPQRLYGKGGPFLDFDLGLCEVEELKNGLILTSPICSEIDLQIEQRILMDVNNPGIIRMIAQLINRSTRTIEEVALWNVANLLKPCQSVVTPVKGMPVDFKEMPGGDWMSSVPSDVVFPTGNGYALNLNPGDAAFKVGFHIKGEKARIRTVFPLMDVNLSRQAVLDISVAAPPGKYPHAGPVEIYNCPDARPYVEVEAAGRVQELKRHQISEPVEVTLELS